MDTSKEYIKMCDCPEIQGKIHNWRDRKSWSALIEERDEFIWLPRQDQIQEMMNKLPRCSCMVCLTIHLNEFLNNHLEGLYERNIDTMEQLWLAFYMSEKHQKFWDGEKWVKSAKE